VAYAENFYGVGSFSGIGKTLVFGVRCLWRHNVIFLFPNLRFGEIIWHNMHILLHALPLFYVSLHWM